MFELTKWYTESHEWFCFSEDHQQVRVGISNFAQSELGDIVYVEFPEVGQEIEKGADVVTIESVKSVSEVISPFSGRIIEVNEILEDEPEQVTENPEETWLVVIEITEKNQNHLMSLADYTALL